MRNLAMRVVVLWGWRRAVAAFVAGALAALSMSPFHFFPILCISFPILIWLLDGIGGHEETPFGGFKAAFSTGWFFGFGYFLAGLYWIGLAFLVDAEIFAWMMPFAVILLPIGLAFFTGISAGLYYFFWHPNNFRILTFAVVFVAGEWLRGHILTGFPWNLFGYSLTFSENLIQIASVVGVYGLSFLCLLVAGCFALTSENSETVLQKYCGPVLGAIIFLVLFSYGSFRIGSADDEKVQGIALRIIQPNISQKEKWAPGNKEKILSKLLSLTNKPTSPETMGVENATHIIWPEVALPTLLLKDIQALSSIAAIIPENKYLITGTIRRETNHNSPVAQSFNSVVVLNDQAKPVAIYDKSHLVPFGEYLPLAHILEPLGVRKLVSIPTGFLSGPGRRTLAPNGTPAFSPLICYEAIFPGQVIHSDQRPLWLLNLTNDAWFGLSAGPFQHFQQSRLRAIEEGLPMIRAANTGISAIIDPYGRIISSLSLNQEGVLDGGLPKSLSTTPYSEYGDLILLILCVASGVVVLVSRKTSIHVSQ